LNRSAQLGGGEVGGDVGVESVFGAYVVDEGPVDEAFWGARLVRVCAVFLGVDCKFVRGRGGVITGQERHSQAGHSAPADCLASVGGQVRGTRLEPSRVIGPVALAIQDVLRELRGGELHHHWNRPKHDLDSSQPTIVHSAPLGERTVRLAGVPWLAVRAKSAVR